MSLLVAEIPFRTYLQTRLITELHRPAFSWNCRLIWVLIRWWSCWLSDTLFLVQIFSKSTAQKYEALLVNNILYFYPWNNDTEYSERNASILPLFTMRTRQRVVPKSLREIPNSYYLWQDWPFWWYDPSWLFIGDAVQQEQHSLESSQRPNLI